MKGPFIILAILPQDKQTHAAIQCQCSYKRTVFIRAWHNKGTIDCSGCQAPLRFDDFMHAQAGFTQAPQAPLAIVSIKLEGKA